MNPLAPRETGVVFPDGVTLHRAGEFLFSDKHNLERLYADNPLQYQDALGKLVQILGTAEKISASRINLSSKVKETTVPLLEKLERFGKLAAEPRPMENEMDVVRGIGMSWLDDGRWQSICKDIAEQRTLRLALKGHIWRDFQLLWSEDQVSPGPNHYVASDHVKHLPRNLLNEFVETIERLSRKYKICSVPSRNQLGIWVNKTVTTHYVILGEYWETKETDYVPSLTRSSLTCLKEEFGGQFGLTKYIATQILQERTVSRSDLLERVLDWTEKEGRGLYRSYLQLRRAYSQGNDLERKDLEEAVRGIRETNMKYATYVGVGVQGTQGKIPESDATHRYGAKLRWIFELPDHLDFVSAVERLIGN